jgi:AraC-like DNA-binding protein
VDTGEAGLPFHLGIDPALGSGVFRLGLVMRGPVRILGTGDAVVLAAGTLFLVPPGYPCRFLKHMDALVETLASGVPTVARLAGVPLAEAGALLESLEREAREPRLGSEPMVRLKLLEGILMLVRARPGAGHGTLRFHADEAQQFIRDHCADPLTLDGLAARYDLNPSYFSRLFHREVGMPLVEFINRSRVQKSCQLLKRTDAGIVEIALAVGYNNLSHFNRSFRRFIGMTPREFRSGGRK